MPKQIGINVGFVTNSSSMVFHFPRAVFEAPEIQSFLKKFELEEGFVGEDLWYRGTSCGTLAITPEQKALARSRLVKHAYMEEGGYYPGIATDTDEVVVVICDETHDRAFIIAEMMKETAERMGFECAGEGYN